MSEILSFDLAISHTRLIVVFLLGAITNSVYFCLYMPFHLLLINIDSRISNKPRGHC